MSWRRDFRFCGWGEKGGNTIPSQNFFQVTLQNVPKLLLAGQQPLDKRGLTFTVEKAFKKELAGKVNLNLGYNPIHMSLKAVYKCSEEVSWDCTHVSRGAHTLM